jgi:hypothetical protein
MDPTFLRHFKEVAQIFIYNFLENEKTGEYEMFLGSAKKMNNLRDNIDLIS